MPTFDYTFTVAAPVDAVAGFHDDTRALQRLTPGYVHIRRSDPMAEGAIAEFTVWLGPIPIRWRALHRDVGPNGFTDIQDEGPMKSWVHTHRFEAISDSATRVHEHIEYEYGPGWDGVRGRLFFSPLALRALFAYRSWLTRRALRG
ncbi:MAG: cyclase [Acidimicrobiia bacterium]|nr:cyclase [Acidimicrobiia bacterium]